MGPFGGFEHVVRDNEPLAPYTWFRLGGPAEYFAEPTSIDELSALIERGRDAQMPVRLLGGGSSLLVRERGVPGLVLHLAAPAFSEITVQDNLIRAGGGAKLSHVVSTAVREGLGGLEQLVGIPGTTGGALRGNAGTQNDDIGQTTRSATVMKRSGEILTRQRQDLRFAYRSSSLDELVILSGEFELEPSDPVELTKRMQTLWIVKRAKQPAGSQAASRVFKNPSGASAARLIDEAGMKGAKVGQAEVAVEHPEFLVAHPGAKSDELLQLIAMVQDRVDDRVGVRLDLEIEIW